ncbi:MAG: PEP-CTERM sorting domain-containing protein [Acidobacteriota bacterium]|nr:PEP-CTERM sorting domain-containing protein [Acidobacteriota bacterium]
MHNIRPIGFLAIVLLFVAGIPALQAAPIADLSYVETDLGGGFWKYEYTLTNLADPTEDAGYDLYDLFLIFDKSATVEVVELPLGWEFQKGFGFIDIYSGIPGIAPYGCDIAPGESLSGFVLQFDYMVGELPFEVMFTNPASVPEPSTSVLVLGGLAGLAFFRKYRRVPGER